MNPRVLELIKKPELIQKEDLKILEAEIHSKPYIQSFRALYLYGVKQFEEDNYKNILTQTAAYTTDKKILYHFIVKDHQPSEMLPKLEEKSTPEDSIEMEPPIDTTENKEIVAPIPTKEKIEISENEAPEVLVEIPTENLTTKNEKQPEEPALSFHAIDDFLPKVEMPTHEKKETYIPKKTTDHREDEMQRLIAEVEAKIKAKREQKAQIEKEKTPEPEMLNNNISLAETQDFNFNSSNKISEEIPAPSLKEKKNTENKTTSEALPLSNWKPMSLEPHTPDALLPTKAPIKSETKTEDKKNMEEKTDNDDRPALNVSFFTPTVSKIEEKTPKKIEEQPPAIKEKNSNVNEFIATWQSWLMIDKQEELTPEQVIDNFIENEPKISKLKEDNNFVLKEKDDDISHLMTETLAKIYLDQRLYAKAIRAYEILQEKYPEKALTYTEKIEEIKEMRTNK